MISAYISNENKYNIIITVLIVVKTGTICCECWKLGHISVFEIYVGTLDTQLETRT